MINKQSRTLAIWVLVVFIRLANRKGNNKYQSFSRRQINAEKLLAVDVAQTDGHRLGLAVDFDRAEKLEAFFRRAVWLQVFWGSGEFHLRAEGVVHFALFECARVQRPGDEF